MKDIILDATELARDCLSTADEYMRMAINNIDKRLGEGYAEKHPELVAAYMTTTALDYQAAATLIASQNVRDALDAICSAIDDVQRKM